MLLIKVIKFRINLFNAYENPQFSTCQHVELMSLQKTTQQEHVSTNDI